MVQGLSGWIHPTPGRGYSHPGCCYSFPRSCFGRTHQLLIGKGWQEREVLVQPSHSKAAWHEVRGERTRKSGQASLSRPARAAGAGLVPCHSSAGSSSSKRRTGANWFMWLGPTYSPRGSSLISLWLSCPYLKVSRFCRSSSLFSNFSWIWSSFVCRWLFVWRDCSRLKASFLLSSLATSRAFCRGSIWKREGSFQFHYHRCKKSVTLHIHSLHFIIRGHWHDNYGTRTKDSSCLQ